MDFFITCDANWESKVSKALDALPNYRLYFEKKDYGTSVNRIGVVLMCQNPTYNFKQRIRFSKKDKILSMDIMLDLQTFEQIDQEKRQQIIAEKFVMEIPPIIKKYKFENFDFESFSHDLKKWFKKIKWLDT